MTQVKPKRPVGRPRANGRPHLSRGEVFKSAAKLIAELGFAGASLRKIADDLGVAAPSILGMFNSKDQLLNELIEAMAVTTLNYHQALHESGLKPDVMLYKMVYEEVISVATYPQLTRLFYLPELRLPGFESAQQQRVAMVNNVQDQVELAVVEGLFHGCHPRLLAEQIFQLTETSMIALDANKLGSVQTQAASATSFCMRACLVRPSRLDQIVKTAAKCLIEPERDGTLG